ncbi:hypothetical protein C8P63_12552 [Melghirimyces profundicolus]|uniref:CNNM transmembrane domain-containing protein n=1 Tax=Melghirimyces profundicolus TaxID=1242148 RepID=A0A2T6BCZ1_9BACL|nr:hypothetical protein [Melghirimyces profundicolus]PTX53933.1 hypothetical protein C8P63_12552 [Melghirimyces profundicolus]
MREIVRQSLRWAALISVVTAMLSVFFSMVSAAFLRGLPWQGGMLVVLLIVLVGVFFDMLGIAATAAREPPFHAMAAHKVPGARHAIGIIRRADQFANFCNDVIGDISGIVSGAAGFAVVAALVFTMDIPESRWFLEPLMVGIISALTVGGKALGKTLSIRYSNEIVFRLGKVFYILEKRFYIRLFEVKTRKKRKRKRGVLRAPRTD